MNSKKLRDLGEEQFEHFIMLAKYHGYPGVAEEIQRKLEENDWDCITDVAVIVSGAYARMLKGEIR